MELIEPKTVTRLRRLITYQKPPLVEVAISVQFAPPKGLTVAHFGAFWESQSDDFPEVRVTQPISPSNESFGKRQWLPPSLQFELVNEPPCRVQMTSTDDQWVCQVQRNRLVVNWRKKPEGQYPRFSKTRDRLQKVWHLWNAFLERHRLPVAEASMWEIIYVNQLSREDKEGSDLNWSQLFTGLWSERELSVEGVALRSHHGQWTLETSSPQARLYVDIKPGRTSPNVHLDELLSLSLTVRGPINSLQSEEHPSTLTPRDPIRSGLDFGHKLAVSVFDSMTTNVAKAIWERTDDA